ncbi:phage replisome organizer N-terminal domain-containing protein [Bacillus norwichensis]|uniref:Phage replisome organizer N-terminal domain-containing protein n=1 Tax=Bacillus norwichensis TaxID=2762217 RepID=A0ABR8VP54_9BACI|nr:phage replisome organizer N-terminal domain-containing protein [Bacillus norwichensis]MBD8006534.1 phage replisome organizer N-terminal domain-containing protein [Bacillus norwichensis]
MMSVKWIKLSTQMFEDEKIRLIESMPEADTILIIWIKLLAQAGKTNASGYIYLSENIPYTEEMLATIFNRPLNVVRMALKTLQEFGMIGISNEHLVIITNWEKHQNIEGMERVRRLNAERNKRYRERKKLATLNGDINDDVSVTSRDDADKDIDNIPYVEIVHYLNNAVNTNYRHTTKKTKELIKALWNEGFRLEDFKTVINIKCKEWLFNENMNKFLRPETLFGTKFESYLNQIGGEISEKDNDSRKVAQEYNIPF